MSQLNGHSSGMRMSVAGNIALCRHKAGLTQSQVGRALGLEKETIPRIEGGKISVSIDRLEEFALVFKCSLFELLFGESQTFTSSDTLTPIITQMLGNLSEEERKSVLRILSETVNLVSCRY